MRKHFRLTALSFTLVGLWCSLANAQAVPQAVLSVDPTSQTTSTGSVVTVDVNVSNVSDLYGYQFDLTYNSTVLSLVSETEGSFLSSSCGGNCTFFSAGEITNPGPVASVANTFDTLEGPPPGVTGSGTLVAFTFDAIGAAGTTSALGIQNEYLVDSNSIQIADTTTAGSVTVGGGVAAAPEIDTASAASALTLLLGGIAVLRGRRVNPAIGRRN